MVQPASVAASACAVRTAHNKQSQIKGNRSRQNSLKEQSGSTSNAMKTAPISLQISGRARQKPAFELNKPVSGQTKSGPGQKPGQKASTKAGRKDSATQQKGGEKREKKDKNGSSTPKPLPKPMPLSQQFGNKKKKPPQKIYDLTVRINLEESGLSEDQVAEFKEAFMLFDKDEDGTISENELKGMMESLGERPSDEDVKRMVIEGDTDGNGTIEFNEFLQLMSKKMRESESEDQLIEAFRVFDKTKAGVLSVAELRHVMTHLGEKLSLDEVDDMMKEADNKGEGQVNYNVFASFLSTNSRSKEKAKQ